MRYGIANIEHMEMLALFHGGMGLDRISDVVCNILKSEFIKYTQEVCERHGVPMRTFMVKNAAWTEEYVRWQNRSLELPLNPFLAKPLPVLLTPQEFIKDIPVVTANDFWTFAWSDHGEELRDSFNYDIARKVPRRVKARLARRNIPIVQDYLRKLETSKHDPYPVDADPYMLLNWYDAGAGIAARSDAPTTPQNPEDFKDFASSLMSTFKRSIEDQGGWELLWHNGVGRKERVVQRLFQSVVVHYCRANNVDITPESNAGRGPVDFKFSQGWRARAIVEMKLIRNSKFWDGLLAQVPQYAKSEEVQLAFFVAVAYADNELSAERIAKVDRAAKLASDRNSIEVHPIIIDARRPKPSSKLTPDEADRAALHDNAEPTDTDGDDVQPDDVGPEDPV